MKKTLLRIILGCLVIVLAGLVAIGVIFNSFDPNDYKKDIADAVFKATGKQIVFDGELQATVFPVLGLKTGRIRIADEADFGRAAFVQVKETTFQLALLPLFAKDIQIEEVFLDGVTIKFATSIAGKNNWEFAKNTAEVEAERKEEGIERLAPPEPAQAEVVPAAHTDFTFSVGQITCTDIVVRYINLGDGTAYRLGIDSFTSQGVALGQEIPFAFSGFVANDGTKLSADFSVKGGVRLETTGSAQLMLDSLVLVAGKEKTVEAGESVTIEFSAEALYDAFDKRVEINNWKGSIMGAPFTAKVKALLAGNSALAEDLQFDVESNVNIAGTVSVDTILQIISKQKTAAAVADALHAAEGIIAVKDGADVNSLAALSSTTSAPLLTVQSNPLAGLAHASIKLDFFVDGLIVGGAKLGQLAGIAVANASGIKLQPFSCTAYKGNITGSASVTGKTAKLQYRAQSTGSGIDMATLLQDVAGYKNMSGSGQYKVELTGAGQQSADILQSLNGSAFFAVTSGTISGLHSVMKDTPIGAYIPSSLPFEHIRGNYAVSKGVAVTKDTQLKSTVLTADATGKIGFVAQYIDMMVRTALVGQIPAVTVAVQGQLANPAIKIDARTLLQDAVQGKREIESVGKGLKNMFKR